MPLVINICWPTRVSMSYLKAGMAQVTCEWKLNYVEVEEDSLDFGGISTRAKQKTVLCSVYAEEKYGMYCIIVY